VIPDSLYHRKVLKQGWLGFLPFSVSFVHLLGLAGWPYLEQLVQDVDSELILIIRRLPSVVKYGVYASAPKMGVL